MMGMGMRQSYTDSFAGWSFTGWLTVIPKLSLGCQRVF